MDSSIPEEYQPKPISPPYKLPTYNDWYQLSSKFYHPMQAGSIDGTDVIPHDNGVIRAMMSNYKPNKLVQSDPYKTLFACRFDRNTNEETIFNIFIRYGQLKSFRLVRDVITGFSKGYAFIEFERGRDARSACREAHDTVVEGKHILVAFECERLLKGWKPRRFGGGLGGQKESGQLRFGGKGRPFRKPYDVNKNPMHNNNRNDDYNSNNRNNQSNDRFDNSSGRDRDRGYSRR